MQVQVFIIQWVGFKNILLIKVKTQKILKLIVAMALPKLGEKINLWDPNCGNAIAEIGRKKNCFGNCGNGIAENEKKKIVLSIVAMALPKMEKKKKRMFRNLWKSKKKVVTYTIFLQHFNNKLHVISYY